MDSPWCQDHGDCFPYEFCPKCREKNMMQARAERPPIGIMPRWLWEEQRLHDLEATIHRFVEARQPINPDWIDEQRELYNKVKARSDTNAAKAASLAKTGLQHNDGN